MVSAPSHPSRAATRASESLPGVAAATRYKVLPHQVKIGDQTKTIPDEGTPNYHAVYEFDNPAVLDTPEWAEAIERGRWPSEVRPYTRNRQHVLLERR